MTQRHCMRFKGVCKTDKNYDNESQYLNRSRILYKTIWFHILFRLSILIVTALIIVLCTYLIYFYNNKYEIFNRSFYSATTKISSRRLAAVSSNSIELDFDIQNLLEHLAQRPLDYFIFLWIIIAIPFGFGFCCWLCAQRSYQKITAVSP